ncbi:MAG: hypothetical protein NC180_02640 [Muribaculaceae bacterium]|nr:D-alanyl-D-alanine carboxypeptidase [Roseburia sp.]MCM1432097.1 hypothetical protein [Muribaculaceae bacterium]MCM1492103.1 hypothetical protein [Muribaculaceae bacterium]
MKDFDFEDELWDMEEQIRQEARSRERRQRAKNRQNRRRMTFAISAAAGALAVSLVVFVLVVALRGKKEDPRYIAPTESGTDIVAAVPETETQTQAESGAVPVFSFEAHATEATGGFSESVVSGNGVLIDVEKGEILAGIGVHERISPASMTKILTVLVASEHISEEELDAPFTMTREITDYSYIHDCSNTGFEVDEVMTVRDLFYGTILPSGADSAVGLATWVAGSHEAFVELMNEKLADMGLAESTHFTNCVGLYDEEHYSTVYDMAVILKAATDDPWCREVLSAHKYTTSATEQHPEGITISNWFLRRIEDKDTHGEVLCAKTGYVSQSGSCAASLASDHSGREYICVTAGSSSSWRCIYDHVDIYTQYLAE